MRILSRVNALHPGEVTFHSEGNLYCTYFVCLLFTVCGHIQLTEIEENCDF